MKKTLLTILAAAMVGIMAFGCSSPAPAAEQSAAPQEEQVAEGTEEEAPALPGEEQPEENPAPEEGDIIPEEAIEGEMLYGKVKSIVGNEIELEVAKPPFADIQGGDQHSGDSMQAAGAISFSVEAADGGAQVFEATDVGDATGEAAPVSGTISSEDSAQTIVAVEGADGKMQVIGGGGEDGMELEYTGETKNVIIPAGAEIMNVKGEGTLESIKKGSVLMLMVKDASVERVVANHVTVWE